MKKLRILMYGGLFLTQIALSFLLDDPVKAALIVGGVFIPSYLVVSMGRHKRRVALLDDACDPEAFIEATQKQHEITGKNKRFSNYLRLDLSAGLATAGRFEEALVILDGLDEKVIMKKPVFRHVFNNNRYVTLRGLGRHEEANRFFEENLLSADSDHKTVKTAVALARCDYEFHQKNYQACHDLIELLKQMPLSRRISLYLSLMEGKVALGEGKGAIAKEHFERVIAEGSRLYIAKEATGCLMIS